VETYTRESEPNLERTLEYKKKTALDKYLSWVIVIDMLLVILGLMTHEYLIQFFGSIYYSKSGIEDICNEMISSTLSLGGFIITALSVLLAVCDSASERDVKQSQKAFFFATPAFPKLLKVYGQACFNYVVLFLCFVVLRAISDSLSLQYLFYGVFLSVGLAITTLVRCLYLMYLVLKLK
jgi:hypothetical protein